MPFMRLVLIPRLNMARMERELNYVASDARVHEQSVAPGSPKSFLCGTLHGLLWLIFICQPPGASFPVYSNHMPNVFNLL